MNTLRIEAHNTLDGMNGVKLDAALALLRAIAHRNEEKEQIIRNCLLALGEMDEIYRLVVVTALKAYIEEGHAEADEDPLAWFKNPIEFWNLPKEHADGVFIDNNPSVRRALRHTGEFVTAADFTNIAETLWFSPSRGPLTSERLYCWVAGQQPDSIAAEYYSEHILDSGSLSVNRDIHGRNVIYPNYIIFHRSVLEDYVDAECIEGERDRKNINPIITLLATDDWEFAISQLSEAQRRKLK